MLRRRQSRMPHRTIHPTEADERSYLETVKEKLRDGLAALDDRVRRYADEIQAQKEYMWESRTDMDHAEKVSARQTAHETKDDGCRRSELHQCSLLQPILISGCFQCVIALPDHHDMCTRHANDATKQRVVLVQTSSPQKKTTIQLYL